jgi:hypothetical protein
VEEAGGEDRRPHGGETEEDGRSLAIGTGGEMAMKGFSFLLGTGPFVCKRGMKIGMETYMHNIHKGRGVPFFFLFLIF